MSGVSIPNLPPAISVSGSEEIEIVQSGTSRRATLSQVVSAFGVSSVSFGSTGLLPSTPSIGDVVVSGTLNVASGGTGATTLTPNGLLYGNGTSAVTATAAGTTGQVLVGNTGSAPSWAALTSTAVTSISFGTTGLTPSTPTQGAITVAGTLAVANGGTGVTTSTGTGSVVLSTSPTLVTPTLGVASATSIATALGAIGTPSYTFTGDLNTGLWSPAADTVAVSTGGSERMRITSGGNVLIGTTTVGTALAQVNSQTSAAGNSFRTSHRFADSSTGVTQSGQASPYIVYLNGLNNALNTTAIAINTEDPATASSQQLEFNILKSSGAVASGQRLGRIIFGGDDATNIIPAASIDGFVDGTTGTNDMPGRLVFSTTADGAATVTERMRIDSAGNVLVTGAGGLGYGTGSGGAVTQLTSRTTGVTLNKTNGAITLVSAAGTTAWQSFTVTNSTVAATDTVIVSQKSGTDLYQIFVTAVAAGSFRITFATTGGTTTEQPVFNFAVIKAVTA